MWKILIVDDTPLNLALLGNILSEEYEVQVATNGVSALEIAARDPVPDLVLLDIMMPDMNGYEVCRRLKGSRITSNIPVIFVTAMGEEQDEAMGFKCGAVDYITKPISPSIVRARVKTHLALYDQNRVLEKLVEERTQKLALSQDVTIHSMAVLAETRDNETGGHIIRTKNYVLKLAEYFMNRPGYRELLDPATVKLFFKSTPLHDIGKVGVPDAILLKPGKLTSEEFEIMKTHTTIGRDAIESSEKAFNIDSSGSFLRFAREIAYTHHEKWDGSGYPLGLAGTDIPLSGRMMAVADVYDALISKRVYKPPFSHKKAVSIITEGRGSHFDPDLVDAFLVLEREFKDIAIKNADSKEELDVLES